MDLGERLLQNDSVAGYWRRTLISIMKHFIGMTEYTFHIDLFMIIDETE